MGKKPGQERHGRRHREVWTADDLIANLRLKKDRLHHTSYQAQGLGHGRMPEVHVTIDFHMQRQPQIETVFGKGVMHYMWYARYTVQQMEMSRARKAAHALLMPAQVQECHAIPCHTMP